MCKRPAIHVSGFDFKHTITTSVHVTCVSDMFKMFQALASDVYSSWMLLLELGKIMICSICSICSTLYCA